MRNWQRSTTEWTGVGPFPAATVSETRRVKSISGSAAKRSGSDPSTWKFRSGMRLPPLQVLEEPPDLVPRRLPAREPSPVRPDQADQLIALVDADTVIFARRADPMDE